MGHYQCKLVLYQRVVVVALGKIGLCLGACQVFQELHRRGRVRRGLQDTGTGDVDVCAAILLIGEDHPKFLGQSLVVILVEIDEEWESPDD